MFSGCLSICTLSACIHRCIYYIHVSIHAEAVSDIHLSACHQLLVRPYCAQSDCITEINFLIIFLTERRFSALHLPVKTSSINIKSSRLINEA